MKSIIKMSTKGERSIPGPTSGTYRRIGLNSGSVDSCRNLTKGLFGSALNQDAMARPKIINIRKLQTAPSTVAIPLNKNANMATTILFELTL
jgi:hypothetical protein